MPRIGWMRPPARWVIPLPVATLSITMLMRENKDRQVFARMGGGAKN